MLKNLYITFDQRKFEGVRPVEEVKNVLNYFIGPIFLEILTEESREFIKLDLINGIYEEKISEQE